MPDSENLKANLENVSSGKIGFKILKRKIKRVSLVVFSGVIMRNKDVFTIRTLGQKMHKLDLLRSIGKVFNFLQREYIFSL